MFVGWGVLAVVVSAALHARSRVRSGRAFEGRLYSLAAGAVDLQVLLGAAIWGGERGWEDEQLLRAWGHPGLAIAALVIVHLGLRQARNERWAAEAYVITGRTLLLTAALLGASAGIAVSA